jgi:hypothetical protein
VDDMATDFMAPLARGVLTPGLSVPSSWRNRALAPTIERGTSLCRFWEQRFGWSGCNNLAGYGGAGYGDKPHPPAPLVLFNATRAREGTRFVIGFPPLPREALRCRPTRDEPGGRPPDRDTSTQTLADFWPRYRLSLGEAVRLSANFPWGLHTGRLWKEVATLTPSSRDALAKDPRRREEVRDLLTRDGGADRLRALLPSDRLSLPEQLAGPGSELTAADALEQIARRLEELQWDPRVREKRRRDAAELLGRLTGMLARGRDNVDLIDGGVNDNTGLPALWEVVQHLRDLESGESDVAALMGPGPRAKARTILGELRKRGVVLVEIDSGAKPKLAEVPEVRVPAQALENAGYASAFAARDWYLQRIKDLLAVKGLPVNVTPLFVLTFTCNHSRPGDVLTAWALAPTHTARILATFACECVEWEQLERPDYLTQWLGPWEVHKGLRKASPVDAGAPQQAQESLLNRDRLKRSLCNQRMRQ